MTGTVFVWTLSDMIAVTVFGLILAFFCVVALVGFAVDFANFLRKKFGGTP